MQPIRIKTPRKIKALTIFSGTKVDHRYIYQKELLYVCKLSGLFYNGHTLTIID